MLDTRTELTEKQVDVILALGEGERVPLMDFVTAENEDALPALLVHGIIEGGRDYTLTPKGLRLLFEITGALPSSI